MKDQAWVSCILPLSEGIVGVCPCVEVCDSHVYGTPMECVSLSLCVYVCATIVSIRLVTTEMIFPWGGAVFTPLCPASHERHRALCSRAYLQALWSCQSRFWSVTKLRKMFTTSRAISAHTSSQTFHLFLSCPLFHVLSHKPCRSCGGTHRYHFFHLTSSFAPRAGSCCGLPVGLEACSVPGQARAVGRAEL